MPEQSGIVFLVGAGPGAADLITLRGAEVMRAAEVVIYDYLVNEEILALAPPAAELVYAGKRGGGERSLEQADINRAMVEHARWGRRVVRLKGGDPFIFGRGGEEASALADAGIRFEVVPGVTSAVAVPAFAGIPLTHREHGSFVAFVPGHEDPAKGGRPVVPWGELARATRQGGTLVLLMAAERMRENLARLLAEGMPPATPAAAIQWGTTAAQVTVATTLGTLADDAQQAGLTAPSIIVVGEVAAMRERLKWYERMPLFGRRIVVTRARTRASHFAQTLRALGAEVIEFATIEVAPPTSFATLDAALARLADFDWIVFTSAQGVEAFIARLAELGRDVREAQRAKLAAIGPATAAALRRHALRVAVTPAEYRAEALAAALGDEAIRDARFLIPRAQAAREILPATLRAKLAAEVIVAPAYQTVKPAGSHAVRIRELAAAGAIDMIAFTSSSTVSNFCELAGAPPAGLKAAAIGPITAATARELGFDVAVAPAEYTARALAAAIAGYFTRSQSG